LKALQDLGCKNFWNHGATPVILSHQDLTSAAPPLR
jgi:hypothetical protein